MASSQDESSKTEQPTSKRLRDAKRKEGDVHKSKDLSSVAGIISWSLTLAVSGSWLVSQLSEHFISIFSHLPHMSTDALLHLGREALVVLVLICGVLFLGGIVLPVAVEFLQIGFIWVPKRVALDFSRLNLAQGFSRMFSMDSAVAVVGSLAKTTLILAVLCFIFIEALPSLANLFEGRTEQILYAYTHVGTRLIAATCIAFLAVGVVDALYQRYSYLKRLRMSRQDIRQEQRSDEGDPHIRAKRRQLHKEWASRNAMASIKTANAVVTNPTHLAVAITYAPPEIPVPMVVAKGADDTALLIRMEAAAHGVPTIENVSLARALFAAVEEEDYIPEELFLPVAETLFWAQRILEDRDTQKARTEQDQGDCQ
jgi:type III secretion protein U